MENSEFSEETTADVVVQAKMLDYAIHTHRSKLPHIVDGLKPIHRRILWTIKDSTKAHKVATWTGNIMAQYHPTGNASIEDAIARLAQPFNNIVPLVHSESNVGAYGGGDAAAARYLPVKASPFTVDLFFKGIDDSTYNYVPSETGEGLEPEYLIPKLPTALMTGSFGIAIGHKAQLQSINLKSLCELVRDYVVLKQSYGNIPRSVLVEKLSHHLLPDFPVMSLLRNEKALLVNYRDSQFDSTVVTDGIFHITPTAITIRTLPYGENINSTYIHILEHLRGRDVYKKGKLVIAKDNFIFKYCQKVDDLSKGATEARLEITMKRGVSPFSILNQLKKLISFTKQWKPITLLIDKENISQYMTPLSILESWYLERSRSIMAELKHTQGRYIKRLRNLSALIIINEDVDFVLNLFKTSKTHEDTIMPLCKRFKLTQAQALFLSDLTMRQITSAGIQKLLEDKKETEIKLHTLQSRFLDIPKQISEDTEYLMKKYSDNCKRRCNSPDFIGIVHVSGVGTTQIGTGSIQYSSIIELEGILTRFNTDNTDIKLYPAGPKNKILVQDEVVYSEDDLSHPKDFIGDNFATTRMKPKFSIGLRKNTIYRVAGLHAKVDKDLRFIYVGDNFTSIDKRGNVDNVITTSVTVRKAVVSTGILTDIEHVSPVSAEEVYVIYTNSKQVNVVSIDRVKMGDRIKKLPMGHTTIIAVVRVGEPLMFTVPKANVNRCNIRQFYISNKHFMGEVGHVKLELSRKACSDGRRVVRLSKNSQLYTIK
jgi:hypothetical protein